MDPPIFSSRNQFNQVLLGFPSPAAPTFIAWTPSPAPSAAVVPLSSLPNPSPNSAWGESPEVQTSAAATAPSPGKAKHGLEKSLIANAATIICLNLQWLQQSGKLMAYHFVDPAPFMPRGCSRVQVAGRKPMTWAVIEGLHGRNSDVAIATIEPTPDKQVSFASIREVLDDFLRTHRQAGLEVFNHVCMVQGFKSPAIASAISGSACFMIGTFWFRRALTSMESTEFLSNLTIKVGTIRILLWTMKFG